MNTRHSALWTLDSARRWTQRIAAWLLITLSGTSYAASIEVIDDLKHPVQLTAPAQRIISLAPHITELLYAVGAGDAIVGAVDYSDYPPPASRLPRVGGYNGFDIEAIAALHPDLIIAWRSGNPSPSLASLERLRIPIFFSEPREIEDVATSLERFGILTGHVQQGTNAAADFRRHLATLQQRYKSVARVTVFYEVWNHPLMTVNNQHLISKVLGLCGGDNIFGTLPALVPQPDIEAVLQRDPQVIMTGDAGNKHEEFQKYWQRWPSLQAVRNHQLYQVSADLLQRHGPRILDGAEQVCRVLDTVRARR